MLPPLRLIVTFLNSFLDHGALPIITHHSRCCRFVPPPDAIVCRHIIVVNSNTTCLKWSWTEFFRCYHAVCTYAPTRCAEILTFCCLRALGFTPDGPDALDGLLWGGISQRRMRNGRPRPCGWFSLCGSSGWHETRHAIVTVVLTIA